MSTNQTANYQLSQWVKSDQVKMEDFNADNAKIDAALAALATKVPASHLSAYTTSYSGNGAASRTFTFSGKPMFLMILNNNQIYFSARGISVLWYRISTSTDSYASVSWKENSITMSGPGSIMSVNFSGQYYQMFALLET